MRIIKSFLMGIYALSIPLLVSAQQSVPYSQNFDTATGFGTFTVVDANNDGTKWAYEDSKFAAYCSHQMTGADDDWLFTPALNLKAGHTYELTFSVASVNNVFGTEDYSVSIGTSATVSGMTKELLSDQTLGNGSSDAVTKTLEVKVETDGIYYIGFHSATNGSNVFAAGLLLDNIKISEGVVSGTPASVANLVVKPGSKGAKQAKITFTTPSKTFDGKPLTSLSGVRIYRDGALATTLTEPGIGVSTSWTDHDVTTGKRAYSVIAYNAAGESLPVSDTIYVGVDKPLPASNVKLIYTNGTAHLTWEAPSVGVNGGYIDVSTLKYNIKISRGDLVTENATGTSYDHTVNVDNLIATGNAYAGQALLAYYVTAFNEVGSAERSRSNAIVIGEPYKLPFVESFANGKANYLWAQEQTGHGRWDCIALNNQYTQDQDGGCYVYTPNEKGETAYGTSGLINLGNAVKPVLTFYYFSLAATNDKFEVRLSRNGGDFQTIQTLPLTSQDLVGKYNRVSIPLDAYLGSDHIQIQFVYSADGYNGGVYVDNISILDQLQNDLSVRLASVPSNMKVGETRNIKAFVENLGTMNVAEGAYQLEVTVNGKKSSSVSGIALASKAGSMINLPATATINDGDSAIIQVSLIYDADEYADNNKSKTATVRVRGNGYPKSTELVAEDGVNGPKLSWKAAAQPRTESKQVADSFETYADFSISNWGDWTLIDADGTGVWGVEECVYANMGTAQAFTIMNPKAVEPAMNDSWNPNQGQKMAVAFASSRGVSDNWLVTPELSGEKQTLTVWMKSSSSKYLEKVQPVVSNVSPEPDQFFGLSSAITVPNTWTQYTYELPEGTRYFAIRHMTPADDGFALFVDDMTFIPDTLGKQDITFIGYNVYRDGELITSTPVSSTTYVDNTAHKAEHTYTVTAVYDKGESAYSNSVTLSLANGIDNISIETENTATEKIYDLQGRLVQSPKRGIYIMEGRKVLVK